MKGNEREQDNEDFCINFCFGEQCIVYINEG